MFSFLQDLGNYEDRKVDRFEKDGLLVSTARVSDGCQPYETAIQVKGYYRKDNNVHLADNRWCVVEAYDTIKDAQNGHDKWVSVMTGENPPSTLRDCQNARLSRFLIDEDYLIWSRPS